jgi:hypothetical protein
VLRLEILLIALLVPALAHAEAAGTASSARLELVRPAEAHSCLSAAALERSVEQRLRRAVFRDATPALLVRVMFERRLAQWVVRIELRDAEGPLGARELSTEAAHCSALDDSLALVVALLVETPPERESAPSPTPNPTPAAPAPPPARGPVRTAEIRVPPETFAPREGARFGIRLSGLAALGLLPGLAFGAELALQAQFPRLPRLVLSFDAFIPRSETLSARDAGAELASQRLGLEVCPALFASRPARVELCLGQRVGRMRAEGFGFDRNLTSNRLYYAVSAGLASMLALSAGLELSAGMRAEVPFTRDDFAVRPDGGEGEVVFRPAPLSTILQIGLGAYF